MKKFKYNYTVGGEPFENSFNLESEWGEQNPEYIAEDAAADFHNNHDGWEWDWPITLTLWMENGYLLGNFTIERSSEPVFHAKEIGRKGNE